MNNGSYMGRAGMDPEIKRGTGTSGEWINARISMAVYRPAKEKEDQTLWLTIKAFGKNAETLKKYVRKGDQFAVEGSLDCEKWTDKEGQKRETWIIRADKVHLIANSTKDGASSSTTPAKAASGITPPSGRGW